MGSRRVRAAVLLALSSLACAPAVSEISSDYVDLSQLPVCARVGFDSEWLRDTANTSADCEPGWTRVAGSTAGSRPLDLRRLWPQLRDSQNTRLAYPRRRFLEPLDPRFGGERFSLRFLFHLDAISTPPRREDDRVLVLGSIGNNWEIYLNGQLIEREVHRDATGQLRLAMYLRDYRALLPAEILRSGANELVLVIHGHPEFDLAGLAIGRPQFIAPADDLVRPLYDQLQLALILLYLAAGVFHLLFWLLRRDERASLYFSIFALAIFAYFFSRGPAVFSFTRDLEFLVRIELVCLYLTVPVLHCFLETMILCRTGRLCLASLVYHSLCIAGAIFAPIEIAWDALRIWQISTLAFLVYFLLILLQGVRFERIRLKVDQERTGRARGLRYLLFRTVPGNLLLGYLIIMGTAVYDLVDATLLHRADELSRYGFFIFTMGIAAVLANRYIAAVHQVERLNEELHFRIVELNQANRGLRDSEERYRTLVEESQDVIFTLDEDFRFIRANRNMHRILGVSGEKLSGSNFLDLIYVDPDAEKKSEALSSRRVLEDKLGEFVKNRKPIFQKVLFRSNFVAEPKELHLRLEYVNVQGMPEILGKASSVLEDNLLRFFIGERQRYEIGNSLITAEELSQRLVRNISRYLDAQPLTGVRFGLREMLVNAIEHGNLAISYDEKTREIHRGNYKEFIKSRQMDLRYRSRIVQVHYSLNARRVIFMIRDEGAGFDHAAMRARKLEDLDAQLSTHGRGIKMTESAFDRVRYNAAGNQVVLVKYFGDWSGVESGDSKKVGPPE